MQRDQEVPRLKSTTEEQQMTDEVAQQCEIQVWILHSQHLASRQALQNKHIQLFNFHQRHDPTPL